MSSAAYVPDTEALAAIRRQRQSVKAADGARLCSCGHPKSAHRINYNGPKLPSGRRSVQESCAATVTRRHEHGDDSWPCPCRDFEEAS